jgi:protease I
VVRDKNIITSRLPSDLPVFCKEIVNYLQESPRIRNSGKVLKPSNGRAPASPAYTHVAEFTMGPRGVASADYTGSVKMGDRVL